MKAECKNNPRAGKITGFRILERIRPPILFHLSVPDICGRKHNGFNPFLFTFTVLYSFTKKIRYLSFWNLTNRILNVMITYMILFEAVDGLHGMTEERGMGLLKTGIIF